MAVAITKAKVDFSGVVCLPPSVIAGNGLDGGGAGENDDEPVLVSLSAAPSPQSEAVANELQELSLQPELTLSLHHGRNPNLPPLSERKNVLQLKLQQRRTREELVSQGIMPPLKSPAAFHEQRRSLERARTEDYLKRKIRSRPERSELVRMHILEETSAEPSLQAKQLKLKRARLADDLNEKIAQRPGPMELVEKNILPVESSLKEAIIVGQVNYPKVADNSSFDEDSSDALSPEQPASHESQGSVPSPMDSRICEPLPSTTGTSLAQGTSQLQISADSNETLFLPEQPPPPLPPPPLLPPSLTNGAALPAAKPPPTLIKQSQPKSTSEKSQRSKKAKELKPKVKKLKYHQYIPPDQKQDKGAPPMDSSYAKILQQQQLFLQLQILNQQQQQHYNYQTILPAPPKPPGEQQSGASAPAVRNLSATVSSTSSVSSGSSGLMRQNSNAAVGKPGPLPANLDEMKVNVGAAGSPVKLHGPFFFGHFQWGVNAEQCCCPRAELAGADGKGWRCCPAVRTGGAGVLACRGSLGPFPVALVAVNSCSGYSACSLNVALFPPHQVAELKQELKLRALPVSGTKTDLIERLRAYQEQNGAAGPTTPTPKPSAAAILPKAAEVVVAFPAARLSTGPALVTTGIAPAEVVVATVTGGSVMKFGSTGSTPPVSPTPSERSQMSTGDENSATGDAFGEMVTSPLTQLTLQASPVQFLVKEESSKPSSCSVNAAPRSERCGTGNSRDAEVRDKDQMLQEKDKQIEELTRMLKQKQQLVEMLRLQLEQEKRSQQSLPAPAAAGERAALASSPAAFGIQVKSENGFLSCQSAKPTSGQTDQFSPAPAASQMDTSNPSPVPKKAVMVKQEVPAAEAEPPCQSHSPRLFLGQQGSALSDLIKGSPPPTLITDSTGTHIVLTVTKQSAERQGLSPHGKAGSSCPALQRVQSSPAKTSSQPQCQLPASTPQQPTQQKQQQQPTQQQKQQQQPRGLNQPVRKGQKPGLQVVTGQQPHTILSFSAPPNLQPFFLNGFHKGSLKTGAPGKAGQPSVPEKPSSQPGSPAAPSPSHMDLEQQQQQQHTSLFGTPPPPLPVPSVPMKEPPGYEEAMKQQPKAQENGCSSQQMDDLFDILIESGEISADFKEQSSPAGKDPPAAPACSSPPSSHHSSELAVPGSLGQPVPVGRLEDFLESSTGLPLLTAGHDGPEPLSLIDDLHSEMLSSSAILDHPPSPMDTSELHFAHEPAGGIALDLAEANLDSMDWLELPGGSVMSLAPLSTAAPSLFSTDFLDGHDLQLHWDSCL
ncbi:myocardin-related transcription factor A isoform X2 [Cygnus atratus]|uniref:myocardin-related transcription factor A isoform X2 n=1 Tax=Cygnus atratus TaxID=8868 RepID=UPI0015D60968|nr:myocardin-related transcription factor A isoform X2 [Cygnus atratus]